MKKLIALVCALVILCVAAVSAFAVVSPETLVEVKPAEKDQNRHVVVNSGANVAVDTSKAEDPEKAEKVNELATNANDPNKTTTFDDVKEVLATLENVSEVKVETADIASEFNSISFDQKDENDSLTVELTYSKLKDREEEEMAKFAILLIDPLTGRYTYLTFGNGWTLNKDDGSITVTFPFPGVFALVQIA